MLNPLETHHRKPYFVLAISLSLFFFSMISQAAEELMVRGMVQVYAQPQQGSEVITTLEQGEKVPISSQEYGRFRKVLVQAGGKKRVGYVLKSEIASSRLRERKDSKKDSSSKVYHAQTGIGLPVALSYLTQGAWKFDSTEGGSTEISTLSGTAVYFGFSLDLPMQPSWSLRGELNLRKSNQTGTTKPVGGSSKQVERTISFVSFGATAKFYTDNNGGFWYGGGFELAKANLITLTYASTENVPIAEADYPTYFIIKGGIGQDFHLGGSFFLTPEVRAAVVVNSTPTVIGGELVVTTAFAF